MRELRITNTMDQSLSWEANSRSVSREIPRLLRNPKVHSQGSATGLNPEPDESSPQLPTLFLHDPF
jgi:hypothetical protein